ncbi:MAG: hypothetical protein ACRC8S_15385 [Fimbriiglobus sp.]
MPFVEVLDFCTQARGQLDQCDHGEGIECMTLEAKLRTYAKKCQEFQKHIKEWAGAVFSGREPFDEAVEKLWQEEGWKLHDRADHLLNEGKAQEALCYFLAEKRTLHNSLLELKSILEHWVRPQLAVGPAARLGLRVSPEEASAIKQRLAGLTVPKTSS